MEYENQHLPILSVSTKEELEESGVAVIYVFGSRVSGNHLPFSDLDLGFVMREMSLVEGNLSKLHTTLYDILSSDILDSPTGPKLDISFLQKANPALAMKAIQEGTILFEANPILRADFEESVFFKYDDYRRLQREFEDATLRAFTPSL